MRRKTAESGSLGNTNYIAVPCLSVIWVLAETHTKDNFKLYFEDSLNVMVLTNHA